MILINQGVGCPVNASGRRLCACLPTSYCPWPLTRVLTRGQGVSSRLCQGCATITLSPLVSTRLNLCSPCHSSNLSTDLSFASCTGEINNVLCRWKNIMMIFWVHIPNLSLSLIFHACTCIHVYAHCTCTYRYMYIFIPLLNGTGSREMSPNCSKKLFRFI